MNNLSYLLRCKTRLTVLALLCFAVHVVSAQTFQRQYGTTFNNSFSKIYQNGTNYYVIGSDQATQGGPALASVSYLNSSGVIQWTRRLNINSVWQDAVVTPNGNLFVVGQTLPSDANAQSIMGVIQSNGSFAWVNSYNTTGRDGFSRVVRNPAPQSAANPYYVLGYQFDPSGNAQWDDVVLLTVSETGSIGWKRRIENASDDEFARNLTALPNGDLILAGNRGANGVVLRFNNAGAYQNGASPEGFSFTFNHVSRRSSGGFYAVGQTFPGGTASLIRFTDELINEWQSALPQLTSASQVFEDPNTGLLYVCGTGVFGGKTRSVIVQLTDTGGSSGPSVNWTRYLDKSETSYTEGSIRLLSGNRIAFVDGRVPATGGFGLVCAYASVSDLNLTTCMTKSETVEANTLIITFNGPDIFPIVTAPIPQGSTVANTAVTWQDQDLCNVPCVAAFNAQPLGINPCGLFQFNNTSTGPAPLTYSWNFGDPASGANNTSTATSPNHQFSACGTYTVCVTVSGNGCTNSACQQVTYSEATPPTITCPQNLTLQCNTNTNPPATGVATATDNCTAVADMTITHADQTSGLMPCDATIVRTWTARDKCGNSSTCRQTIFIKDNVPPVFPNCPINSTVNVVQGGCTYNATPPGLATDNCDVFPSLNYTWTDPAGVRNQFNGPVQFPKGLNSINCSAADDCNNQAFCSYTVLVVDNQPPSITCPSDKVLGGTLNPNGACTAIGTGLAPTASDNCPMLGVTYTISGGGSGNNDVSGQTFTGTSTVTYTALDMGGNSKTCSFTVTVRCDTCNCSNGNASPNLVANGNFNLGNTGFTSGWPFGTTCGSGNYGIATNFNTFCSSWPALPAHSAPFFLALDGRALSTPLDLWVTPINLTTNTDYCFSFWWASVYSNVASTPQNFPVVVEIYNGATMVLSVGTQLISQNPAAVWTQSNMSFNSGVLNGAYTIKIRQLTSTLFRDFGLDDICLTKSPRPCTADFNFQLANGCDKVNFTSTSQGAVSYSWNFGDTASGANNTSTQQDPMHVFTTCNKTYTVCLTITCANGTTSTACKNVTISDNVPPIARCQPGVGVTLNPNCAYNVTTQFVDDNSSDNCKIQSMSVNPTTLTGCANHTVTLTVTDWCGNTSTCTMGIQTIETTPPTMTCPPNATVNCQTGLNPWPGTPVAVDNCPGNVAITFTDVTTGLMPCDATVVRTWKATDACNNMATCTQTVFVRDNVPPAIQCPPSVSVACVPNPLPGQATATDNCDPTPTITVTAVNTGQLPCNGAIVRTWKATDDCNNMSTCVQTITVRDNVPPSIQCPPNSTVNTLPGLCYYQGNIPQPTGTDNCGAPVTFVCSWLTPTQSILITPQTQFTKGVNTISCIANDNCGNGSQPCTFTLTVEDRELPKISCPQNLTVQGTQTPPPVVCKATVNGIGPLSVSDNCPMFNVTYSIIGATTASGSNDASGTMFMQGVSTVTYTVTDMAGNKATCSFRVTVECGDCTCKPNSGGFTNMSYRPNSGPNQPVACGQTAVWQCVLGNFTMSGNFMCQGNNCPPPTTPISMFWILKKTPTGPVVNSGPMSGPAFNLSIPNSSFTMAGVYTLTLGGICGGDTCYCDIKIETPGCGDCLTNNCLNFDGTSDFVSVGSPLATAPGNFSTACWFRNERTMPADGFFYRLFGWTGTDRFELGDQGGTLQFYSNPTGFVNSGINVRDGKWHYAVTTYNGNAVNVYLDGNPTSVITATVGAITAFPGNFHIGDWGGGASDPRFWDGCIDEFKVWNTVLTPDQTVDAMQCSADPSNANLLLHFDFNVGIGGQNNAGLTMLPPVKGTQIGALFTFALNGLSSNWVHRGVSQLPDCQATPFVFIEGNFGQNTAYRTKVYNGRIYSLSVERTSSVVPVRPALIARTSNGNTIWRTVINITGYANDFVLTQDGCDFLIVGHSPAFNGDNRSWIARVNGLNGALIWLRTFNLGRRESFTRILLSDNPANSAFPYVVQAVVNNGNISDDDMILLHFDDNGTVSSGRRYNTNGGDDEFFKDLVQLQGCYVMAGNIFNRSVLVFTDNTFLPQAASTFQFQQTGPYILDVEPSFNERFLYVAGEVPGQGAFLAKMDYSNKTAPVVSWARLFPGITSFRKVTVRPNGDIHAIGWKPFSTGNPNMHSVIVRATDNGPTVTTNWMRYIYKAPENNWSLGDIVHYNGQLVFYTDGRVNNPATFGDFDILKTLADNDLLSLTGCWKEIPKNDVNLVLSLTPLNVPQTGMQATGIAGGTATAVVLPMRDPCAPTPCECKYENFAFTSGQQVIWNNFNCNATTIFDLPCPGQTQPIYFSGKLTCLGSCPFAGINWTVKDPTGTPVTTGGSITNSAFSIPITLGMLQIPGVYTIELTGKCGTKECRCIIRFKVGNCPKPCSCTPLAAFQSDVNMGFNYFKFAAPSCKFQFTPKKLTACDQVQWKVAKASDLVFTIVGTTTGNAPFQYTFTTDLTQYVVCMDVTRTVPGTTPPQTCKQSRCYIIDLDCSLFTTNVAAKDPSAACNGTVITNGNFIQEAEPGGLLSGGHALGWDASGGDPEVWLGTGQPDANFVRLRGSRLYSDRLYQDSVPSVAGKAQLRFSFRPIGSTVSEGTELVVRLSGSRQDTNACLNGCQEIMRFPVPVLDSTLQGVWLTAFGSDSVTIAGKYLTFHVENPFTDDDAALQSVVDIDDICLRNFNFVPAKEALSTQYALRLFPNPNTGTFTVELPIPASQNTRFRIADVAGRTLLVQDAQSGTARQTIEAGTLPAGMYFLEVTEEGSVRGVTRFVKSDQ